MNIFRDPYRLAAVLYVPYGVIYFFGAVMHLTPERMGDVGGVPWWVFYLLGALVVVVVPIIVWRRAVWFTRIICFFPLYRAFYLLRKQVLLGTESEPYMWLFGGAALVAGLALFRAGWGDRIGFFRSPDLTKTDNI